MLCSPNVLASFDAIYASLKSVSIGGRLLVFVSCAINMISKGWMRKVSEQLKY